MTAIDVPPASVVHDDGLWHRVRWALTDAWTITHRALLHWRQQPGQIAVMLLFPVMLVLLFAYLFGGAMTVTGGGDYREFLLPGMFGMTMLFGFEATVTTVVNDASRGITDRFRSLPMASSAVVTGRSFADMINATAGLLVLLACGLLVGWRTHHGAGRTLAAVGLLLLLRFALVWAGIYVGLLIRSPEAVAGVQILVWPLGFLSNAFADPATMPRWLGLVAEWNPLSATVSAARALFGNPGLGSGSWATEHAVLMAVVWPLVLVAVFLPLSARRYRRLRR